MFLLSILYFTVPYLKINSLKNKVKTVNLATFRHYLHFHTSRKLKEVKNTMENSFKICLNFVPKTWQKNRIFSRGGVGGGNISCNFQFHGIFLFIPGSYQADPFIQPFRFYSAGSYQVDPFIQPFRFYSAGSYQTDPFIQPFRFYSAGSY